MPAPDDRAEPISAADLAARHGPRYRSLVLLTVMLGTVSSVLSSTIVNVAVPDLIHHFGIGQERAQWVSAAFMASMTLAMLPTPWLLGRVGYRAAYVWAVGLLMVGGIVGGLAPWYELVLAMRVAEGLAAGVLQPIPSIIILRAYPPGAQGRAMGIFGFGVVLAPALGPSVGGLLVEHFGWRSIFFVVVPFCVLALWMARRYLPTTAPGGVRAGESAGPLDVPGVVLATVAVLALLNGLVRLHDTTMGLAAALLAVSAAAFVGFVLRQRRSASPLLSPALFRHRAFAMGGVVAFTYGMGLFGSTYLVPVFMQTALSFPPSEAGAVLLPAGVVLAVTIPLAGRLADRVPPAWQVAVGLALLAASFVAMGAVGTGTALAWIAALTVVGRIGLGLTMPALSLASMRGLAPAELAQGASAVSLLRQLGGAVGVSVVGIFLEWRLHVHGTAPGAALLGFRDTFWLVAAFVLLAVAAAWRMGGGDAKPDGDGRARGAG
jgi:EmrB/QacA subfamily drug resistance transporter